MSCPDSVDGVLPVTFGALVVVYHTHDGGLTWTEPASFTMSADAGMAVPLGSTVGQYGWITVGPLLLVTHDGGATWSTLAHSSQLGGVSQLQFVSATTGWALTEQGACASYKSNCSTTISILRTTDGGRTWNAVAAPALA